MKKMLFLLLAASTMLQPLAYADIDFQDIGPTDIEGVQEDNTQGPFKVKATVDVLGRAKVRDRRHHLENSSDGRPHHLENSSDERYRHLENLSDGRHRHRRRRLQFAIGEVELSAVFYHDASINEGASLAVSYNGTYLDWEHNRLFKQKYFNGVSLTLNFSTERLCDWIWQAQLVANFDNLKHWHFNDYMNYDMLLWGRYNYKDVGINLGFLALTGMKIDRVYPVIGVDWAYNETWKINLVFPVNMAIVYTINEAWAAAIAGRLFLERHRLGPREVLRKGLIVYTTAGLEFGINYSPSKKLFANIHAGYDVGGRFKTATKHYRNKRNYTVEGAPYAGCELDYAF